MTVRSARASRARTTRVQALFPSLYDIADAANTAATAASQAADAATPPPGSVNAPIGVIIGSALVVTLALTASGFLLRPGDKKTGESDICLELTTKLDQRHILKQGRDTQQSSNGW